MFKKMWGKILTAWETGDVKGFLKIFIPLLVCFGMIVLGSIFLLRFLTANFEGLMILGSVALLILGLVQSDSGKKKESNTLSAAENGANNLSFFNSSLRNCLFELFTQNSRAFHIITPTSYSDLKDDLPSCYDSARSCNIYRYKIMGDGTEIDRSLFCELLTARLQERISDGRLSLGRATVEFSGRLYPRIFVDDAIYVAGAWHIQLIIVDTVSAANYIDRRQNSLAESQMPFSPDWNDGDF